MSIWMEKYSPLKEDSRPVRSSDEYHCGSRPRSTSLNRIKPVEKIVKFAYLHEADPEGKEAETNRSKSTSVCALVLVTSSNSI